MTTKTYRPLDELIEKSGLKINAIAQKLEMSPQNLYKIRMDLRRMDIMKMEQLAETLGVDFNDVYEIHKKFRNEVDKNATK